jgi:flagellar hook-associated protein 2
MSTTKSDIYVKGSSTALDALGKSTSESYVSFDNVSSGLQPQTTTQSAVDFLKSNSLTITYGNTTKSLTLLSNSDGITQDSSLDDILSAINNNLSKNENFGSGFVKATASADGKLLLGAASSDDTTTVTLTSSNSSVLNALGVKANASNKLTTSASIADNATALGLAGEDNLDEKLANLTINGKQIEGVTSSTTIDELLSKINKSDAGVKATYLSSSGSFLLVNKDTGAGKTIDLGGSDSIASKLFGGTYT